MLTVLGEYISNGSPHDTVTASAQSALWTRQFNRIAPFACLAKNAGFLVDFSDASVIDGVEIKRAEVQGSGPWREDCHARCVLHTNELGVLGYGELGEIRKRGVAINHRNRHTVVATDPLGVRGSRCG